MKVIGAAAMALVKRGRGDRHSQRIGQRVEEISMCRGDFSRELVS